MLAEATLVKTEALTVAALVKPVASETCLAAVTVALAAEVPKSFAPLATEMLAEATLVKTEALTVAALVKPVASETCFATVTVPLATEVPKSFAPLAT